MGRDGREGWGVCLAQSEQDMRLDLGVVSSSTTLGVEITKKKKLKANKTKHTHRKLWSCWPTGWGTCAQTKLVSAGIKCKRPLGQGCRGRGRLMPCEPVSVFWLLLTNYREVTGLKQYELSLCGPGGQEPQMTLTGLHPRSSQGWSLQGRGRGPPSACGRFIRLESGPL